MNSLPRPSIASFLTHAIRSVLALACTLFWITPATIAQSPANSEDAFLKGWESKAVKAAVGSIAEAEANPLSPDGKKYIQVEGTIDESAAVSYGSTFLNYAPPDGPARISFRFRPDGKGNIRYFFFDADQAQPGTGPNATWHIDCVGGYWRVVTNGGEDGGKERQVKTDIKATPGVVYTFVIETNPPERKWSVTISDDTQSATLTDLYYRSDKQELGGYLHFGISTDAAQKPSEFSFSFGDIQIENLPDAKS